MSAVERAAREVLRTTDAYRDAQNGMAHPAEKHDRDLRRLVGAPDFEVYDLIGDCSACAGSQYGTEFELQQAIVGLRLALGEPLLPFEEEHRPAALAALRATA